MLRLSSCHLDHLRKCMLHNLAFALEGGGLFLGQLAGSVAMTSSLDLRRKRARHIYMMVVQLARHRRFDIRGQLELGGAPRRAYGCSL
jgi:hypothetical protein